MNYGRRILKQLPNFGIQTAAKFIRFSVPRTILYIHIALGFGSNA